MPYTVEELDNLEFYQDIIRRDESEKDSTFEVSR